jgi:hypothetical protein
MDSKRDTRERYYFRWLSRYFFNSKSTNEITLLRRINLTAEITNYPKFTVESIGKDLFESKRADLNFNSMKIKRHLK